MSADGEHRVLAVTAKHTTGAPYFVEVGHDLPASLAPAPYQAVTDAALDALTSIGHRWGPCHTEVMLGRGGDRTTVVEINTRFGGGQIWELVQMATGFDVFTGSVTALAYGRMPPPGAGDGGAAAIRFLTAPPGRIEDITGVDAALAVDGVVRVAQLWDVGRVVPRLSDSWSRVGYVIAAGPDPQTAGTTAEAAAACIKIRTTPDR
jgi:biotin carboxylase